jgi:Flp pilus assembly secretin CpaC
VATNKIKTLGMLARHGAWMTLVLGIVFLSVRGGLTQDDTGRPVRTREALRQAIDLYKSQDYEKAAEFFAYAQQGQKNLPNGDQQDLTKFSASNTIALKSRQDGAAQLRLAADALQQGRQQDAGNLLKSLNANQYLNAAERQQLADLNRKLQTQPSDGKLQQGNADAKTLLSAGRAALQAGDLAGADGLANQADKAGSGLSSLFQPWNDSPAKLRRDIQAVKAKQQPATLPNAMPKNPETAADPSKTTSTSKFMGMSLWPFGGSAATPAKKEEDASERRINEKIARDVVRDGFIFLQANDLEKAYFLAMKAKELNVTFTAQEQTPDQLLHEIQRRKGSTLLTNPERQRGDSTATAKKETPAPTNADPRALLKQGRALLQQRKIEEADKVCSQAIAANARWGLFEDTPEKLRRDIQRGRQSWERDESVRLMVDARKVFAAGNIDDAEKKAYKAQQYHGPYGVFDFGDRPQKLLDEIQKAKVAKGTANPLDKQVVKKDGTNPVPITEPRPSGSGTSPFAGSAGIQNANKNRAIVMVREAQEMERRGMLTEARQKAFEARALKANFTPEEDSPDSVLLSVSAKCDRQILAHLQQAAQEVGDANDPQRFGKAQVQILSARKLAQAFELDSGRIDQTAHYVQQVANGSRPAQMPGGLLPTGSIPQAGVDLPTGDPRKDALRKAARERLAQAQLELSYGKTAQARKMAEELFNAEYGIQEDALKLIRSISNEEYNQQCLEAKRTFEAGLQAFLQKDYRKAMFVFQAIDPMMLPENYHARLGDIMSTREMQPQARQPSDLTQVSGKEYLQGTKMEDPKGPNDQAAPAKVSLMDEVRQKEMVHFQSLRQRGQDALRTAHDMYKNDQKDDAIDALKHYLDQVNLAQFDQQKANELRRLPEARIQQYRTMMAEEKLKGIQTKERFTSFHDEGKRQRDIKANQTELAERVKVASDLYKQHKLKEANAEVDKVLEIDRENVAALALKHMVVNKSEQENYDKQVHGNEKIFLRGLDVGLGVYADSDDPIKFDPKRGRREKSDGALRHELRDGKERAIEYRLRQPISLHFKDVPLEQAIRDLTLMSGVQVQPDYAALDAQNINLQSPLSISVDNVDMKSALNLLLNRLKLSYTIENQVLMITTPEKTKGRLVRVTYPVGDLIVVVPDFPVPDVLNIQKALERSMQPSGTYTNNFLTPPPYAFNSGDPVSSHSQGLGNASFGGQSGGQGQPGMRGSSGKDRSKDAMADVLKELIQNTVAKNTWESMGGNGNIQYFPFGMAMVINQPQEVQEEVALLLATLRRLQDLQVSVELRAVLVSETFFERIGVNFDLNISAPKKAGNSALVAGDLQTATSKGAISGLTSAGTLTPDLGFPIGNNSFSLTTPQFGGYQPQAGLQLGLAFLSEIQVFMFLEAVQGDRRAHIMQAPKLTVFNGQQANIQGDMVRPTVSGLQPAALGNGQLILIPQITQMPFGLSMTVQPVVSPDRRFVRLNVQPTLTQAIQDPAGAFVVAVPQAVPAVFDNGNLQPPLPNGPLNVTVNPTTTSLQILNTTVNVPDGGTVLLGGFKFLAEERTEYGPPILSKIPYLSRLFRNVGWSRDGSTLIYLVTARIIMVEEEERLFLGLDPQIPRE